MCVCVCVCVCVRNSALNNSQGFIKYQQTNQYSLIR